MSKIKSHDDKYILVIITTFIGTLLLMLLICQH